MVGDLFADYFLPMFSKGGVGHKCCSIPISNTEVYVSLCPPEVFGECIICCIYYLMLMLNYVEYSV